MEKDGLTSRYQTEKAIIDALLKISQIVQKTEASREYQKSRTTNKRSKKTVGDGDYNDEYEDNEQQEVPVPPPMRTLDSYISGFNQRSLQKSSNCNQASTHRSRQLPSNFRLNPSEQQLVNNDYEVREHPHKRRCPDNSSTASLLNDPHQRKIAAQRYSSHRPDKTPQLINPGPENLPNITTLPSLATTVPDNQSSPSIIMPVTSAPTIPQPCPSSGDLLKNHPKTDYGTFIDEELQATLEKYLKIHLLSSTKTTNENIQQQRKTRLSSLTNTETGKFINEFSFPKQIYNFDHYEKQRELAMLAAKQGNYSLSYSIHTNLLHDHSYDYKQKSDILASRAMTLLLEQKCFGAIDDCTQAIAFNQWNKLAYVVRAACWMIKQEYFKAVEDYSKLFHYFDQSEYVLDLLNLAYEKLKLSKSKIDDQQSIDIEREKDDHINLTPSPIDYRLVSPTASFIQPAVYLCYPYQAYPSWYREGVQPSTCISGKSFNPHVIPSTD